MKKQCHFPTALLWTNTMLIDSNGWVKYWWFMDEWNFIYGLYHFNVHYIRIWSYFFVFHSIWRSFPIIPPKVETSLFAYDLRDLQQTLKVEWWCIWVYIYVLYMYPTSIHEFELDWVHLGSHFQYSLWGN